MGLCGDVTHTIDALLPFVDEKEERSFLDSQLKLYEKVKERLETYVKDTGKTES